MREEQQIRKKQNLDPKTKKENVKLTKIKGRQNKPHSIKEELSESSYNASNKKSTRSPYSKTDKKNQEPFKEKYRVPLEPALKPFPEKITGSKKDFTVSNKVAQSEKSRITLMDVDPYWLHAYWEIIQEDKVRILKKSYEFSHPYKKIIRVYDVSYIDFDGNNAHSYFDIEIDKDRGNWYINLWSPRKSFCAEIGLCSPEGTFYPIARSSAIDTPRSYQSSTDAEQWMKVTGDYREVVLLPEKTSTEQREPNPLPLKQGEEFPAPELERDTLHSFQGKRPSQDASSSTEKKYSSDITTTSISSQSHKEPPLFQKRVMENEIKGYYKKLRSGDRQQNKKHKTNPIIAPHHKRGASQSEGDFPQRPFAEIQVNYGSDTRWKKEVTGSTNKERKKIITPKMIKKTIPSKMELHSLNKEEEFYS